MASNLIFKSSDGASTVTTLTFDDVTPGTPSAAQALRLLNDDSGGSVDDADSPILVLRQINSSNQAVDSGLRAIDEHWLEVRAPGGGSSGSTQLATGWEPFGNLRSFELAKILAGEYTDVEFRYNPPGSAPEGQMQFLVDPEPGPAATSTANGLTESTRDGVLSGLGDDYYDEILFGGSASEASSPDDTVEYENTQFLVDGKRYALEAGAETLSNQDASSSALSAGEYYWAVFSLGPSGVTVTKSDKDTTPADTTLVPSAPAGEIPWVRVYRDDANVINDADIVTLTETGQFSATITSLNVVLGPGRGRIGNRVTRSNNTTPLALTASTTNYVWLLPDGSRSVTTTSAAPAVRSYLLYTYTTDGSGVTATVDSREPVGGDVVPIEFQFATVAGGGQIAYAIFPLRRDGYLLAEQCASLIAAGAPSGNTTGGFRVDVEYRPPGGSWTSLFATTSTQAALTINAAEDTDAFPSAMRVPAGSILRATVTETAAYDGTAPTNVILSLPLEVA